MPVFVFATDTPSASRSSSFVWYVSGTDRVYTHVAAVGSITRPLAIADGFHYTMSLDLFGTTAVDAGDCVVNLLYTSVTVA